MKQETTEAITRTSVLAAGTFTAWELQHWSMVMAIIAAGVTALYGLVNLFFLIRKWYKLEQAGWNKSVKTDYGDLHE
jgi:hypothetical protein